MTFHLRTCLHDVSSGRRIGVVATALLVAGCVMPSLENISLVRVERTTGIEPLRWKVLPELQQKEPQLRVEMDTRKNVRELARRNELHVSADAFFCGNRDQHLVVYPAVFDRDGNISDSPAQASDPADTHAWIYIAASSTGGHGGLNSADKSVSYDLAKNARDVCVEIRGGSMTLRSLKAPLVSVPAATVRDALTAGAAGG